MSTRRTSRIGIRATPGRADVQRALARLPHPSTRSVNRAKLVSFYDWLMQEWYRKDHPARQTRPSRRRPKAKYRLTEAELVAFLSAASGLRETRAIFLGVCAGLRNAELRGLQGRHFERLGWIWVSADVAKGKNERWVPVPVALELVVAEIRATVALDEYVLLPAQRWRDPGRNQTRRDLSRRPSSSQALRRLVMDVAKRAGIAAHITPHDIRHAYAEHVGHHAGPRTAQHVLGHADIGTTEIYLGKPRLDDLSAAVRGLSFGLSPRTSVLGVAEAPQTALEATTGIEPV
jgi:integrase